MFTLIDNWLFDHVFQKFSDWFRDTYGTTPFWLASICALSYLGLFLAEEFREDTTIIAGYVYCALVSAVWLFFVFGQDQKDKEEQNTLTRTANSWRIIGIIKFCRIVSVVFVLLDLTYLPEIFSGEGDLVEIGLHVGRNLAFCGAYYFASCDTKPPSPKPSTKTVESMATAETT